MDCSGGGGCIIEPCEIEQFSFNCYDYYYNSYPFYVYGIGNPSISYSGSTTICQGSSLQLTTAAGYQYQWKKDGVNITGATQNIYSANQTGAYSVIVTINGCTRPSNTVNVTVNPLPTRPTISVSVNPLAPGGSILTASNGTTYQWYKNGNSLAGKTNETLSVTSAGTYTVTNTVNNCTNTSLPASITSGNDYNFQATTKVNIPGVTTESQLLALSIPSGDISQTITYLDDQGKQFQEVHRQASVGGTDIIKPNVYDDLYRPSKSFLPMIASQSNGMALSNVLSGSSGEDNYIGSPHYIFYNSGSQYYPNEPQPFAKTEYELTPLKRPKRVGSIGTSWQPGNADTEVIYTSNGTDIRLWTINAAGPQSLTTWPSNTLNVTRSISTVNTSPLKRIEQETISNREGLKLVERVKHDGTNWAETHYIYDSKNNLRYILTPQLIELLRIAGNFATTQTQIDDWAYQFIYDSDNRLIEAKPPGVSWKYLVYDRRDRVILSQNGNERGRNEWNYTKYDDLNRPVVSGIYKPGVAITRADIQITVNSLGSGLGYQNAESALNHSTVFPTTNVEELMLSYYDSYDNCPPCANSQLAFSAQSWVSIPLAGIFEKFNRLLDLPTAASIKILDSEQWLHSVTYYNKYHQPIQVVNINHRGDVDRESMLYDFSGDLIETVSSLDGQTIRRRFEHDPSGRLIQVRHRINDQPEVILLKTEYNELDQVIAKYLHSKDNGVSYHQKLDYRYSIKGWLTQLNYPLSTSEPVDYFGMQFAYDNVLPTGNSNRLDGMITGAVWKNNLSEQEHGYNFSYNDLGALTTAEYKTKESAWINSGLMTESNLNYDLNGNITSLNRFGNSGGTAQQIDQLIYNYGTGGNMLYKVTDNAPVAFKDLGFKDGANQNNDFSYDVDGNLIGDENKQISIEYNAINQPAIVTLSDGSEIRYKYDAIGTRLSQEVYDAGENLVNKIDYVGNYLYVNDELETIFHEEGRMVAPSFTNLISNTATREANTLEGYAANLSVSLTNTQANGETHVRVVSNQSSGRPGVWPIGETITVKANERYAFKVLGYRHTSHAANLYVWSNTGDLIWTGPVLPLGQANETWVTAEFTIPNGITQIKVGVLWSSPTNGATMYINRVAVYKLDWEYQYFLKDHLGSSRVVLQTEPHTYTYTATMETANFNKESEQFLNLNSSYEIAFGAANATAGGLNALKMNSTYRIGPSRSFKVMPGDIIDASVMAYYVSGTYTKSPVAAMASYVISALSGGASGVVDGINYSYTNSGTGSPFLLSPDQGSSKPSAFLNYILFDQNFEPISAESAPLGSNPSQLHAVLLPSINITRPGYLFIYLSYDNDTGPEVWFDELKITYKESPVIQISDYYAFGLTSFQWLREGENENKYLFQGKELNDSTGMYDFHARQYDASIGRWLGVDPKSQFASPYLFGFNNPYMTVDPDGKLAWFVPIIVGAVIGGTSQGIMAANNGGTFLGGFWRGALVGAAAGAAGIGATAWAAGTSFTAVGAGTASVGFGASLVGGITGGAVSGGLGALLNGGDVGTGIWQGALGGGIGSIVGMNAPGILTGAITGGASGGLAGGLTAELTGGSFKEGFVNGAIAGAITGGIYGGIAATESKYERNILFGNVTRNGKQNFLNDLASSSDAYNQGLNKVILAKRGDLAPDENGVTRPIINGVESDLNTYVLDGWGAGTKSNVYIKSNSLKGMASTFGHEMVHVRDYFTGYVKMHFINKYIELRSIPLAHIATKNHLEYRAYQSNIQFGYRVSQYQTELNRYLMYK
ncbi:MAG: DUF6443 domain-containing protein [Cyclobacteriaceae bacterium]|nr:MAG: DUF6443 domain-containing protein [Cyclobacteriaceae bacterium]